MKTDKIPPKNENSKTRGDVVLPTFLSLGAQQFHTIGHVQMIKTADKDCNSNGDTS